VSLYLRIWFLVAIASLVTACVLAGKVSALPRVWRGVNAVLIGIAGIAGAIGLGAKAGIFTGVVLVLAVLTESLGLWLGISRRGGEAGRKILVVGGTLCVLFASVRILSGALGAATSSEAAALGELLAEGALQPLLIFLGAVALGIGGRVSSIRPGASGVASSVSFFIAVPLLALAVNEAVVGEFGWKVFALACLAVALALPTLLMLFRGPMVPSGA